MRKSLPLALLLLVACNHSTTTPADSGTDSGTDTADTDECVVPVPTGDPATVPLNGECPLETKWGEFVVANFDFYSIVDGSVSAGVVPVTILENVGENVECKLLKRNNPFCPDACEADETCDFDGNCIPFPEGQDLGKVTVGGLLQEVLMEAVIPGFTYFDTNLPFPAFDPGELIELRTTGGNFEPIELHGVGVEDLVLTEPEWVLFENEDLVFNWTPPTTNPVRSKIHIQLNIDQHGLTPIQLFCEFDDDGQAALPQALVTSLITSGVTGFPNATVTRRTMDSTTIGGGCLEFTVKSPVQPDIRVDGYISCSNDDQCPPGQTCNDVQICE